jgi:hypothetical protein
MDDGEHLHELIAGKYVLPSPPRVARGAASIVMGWRAGCGAANAGTAPGRSTF